MKLVYTSTLTQPRCHFINEATNIPIEIYKKSWPNAGHKITNHKQFSKIECAET